ncbi:MAG TPA: hypothetical protein VK925_00380, partial [Jiangellaceae bacterium]|nr:hypothetical protein [Jiangellaceae bacterium]
ARRSPSAGCSNPGTGGPPAALGAVAARTGTTAAAGRLADLRFGAFCVVRAGFVVGLVEPGR